MVGEPVVVARCHSGGANCRRNSRASKRRTRRSALPRVRDIQSNGPVVADLVRARDISRHDTDTRRTAQTRLVRRLWWPRGDGTLPDPGKALASLLGCRSSITPRRLARCQPDFLPPRDTLPRRARLSRPSGRPTKFHPHTARTGTPRNPRLVKLCRHELQDAGAKTLSQRETGEDHRRAGPLLGKRR